MANFSQMNWAWVPLPAPGAPKRMTRMHCSSRLTITGFADHIVQNMINCKKK
jgi:hypothetical protein